jgi:hypothetical protein
VKQKHARPGDAVPLYPSERVLARAVLGAGREDEWPSIAELLDKQGFAPIDPLMGGRYYPAVEAFFCNRSMPKTDQQLSTGTVAVVPFKPDGVENRRGEQEASHDTRRRRDIHPRRTGT